MTSLRERLLAKAVINWETGCWEWQAGLDLDGYGRIKVSGRKLKAHRVSYEMIRGPIPEGLVIDHLCRVRNCINPAHLEPVTARENNLRGQPSLSAAAPKTHCKHGHEYTPENTYHFSRAGRTYYTCRTCQRKRDAGRPR